MNEIPVKILNKSLVEDEFRNYLCDNGHSNNPVLNLNDLIRKHFKNADEIDKLLALTSKKFSSSFYETETMKLIHRQQLTLGGEKSRRATLKISVFFKAERITIPDPSKDEIELSVTIASSTPRDEFINYLIDNKIITKKKAQVLEKLWKNNEIIGNEDWEVKLLEYLKVMVDKPLENNQISLMSNVTKDGKIALTENLIIKLHINFKYSNYPFDQHYVPIKIYAECGDDLSVITLEPDTTVDSSWLSSMTVPRGFEVTDYKLFMFAEFEEGYDPVSIFYPVFWIKRLSETSIWRIFLPTFVIMAFVLTATGVSLLKTEYVESIMTSVLPGVLLASVALQLVAAQSVPPFSGKTIEDSVFLGHYLILFLSFLSLLFEGSKVSSFLFLTALGIFVMLCLIYLFKSKVISELGRKLLFFLVITGIHKKRT